MNDIFRPLLPKFILVFFDDILVYSPNDELHKQHLTATFEKLEEHQLFLNLKKCEFGKSKLSYLGHVISSEGVSVENSKIEAMMDWPTPKNIKELRGFLELTGYYRKFI